jgi:CDP-paratose 2-epimerase
MSLPVSAPTLQAPELDRLGMVEWFRVGEHDRVERTLAGLADLGITRLRTAVSWADFHTETGPAWYDWLLPALARHVEVLPCFLYTPPSLAIEPKTSAPPRDPKAFADFLDLAVDRYGRCFEWVDLWNEPNNLNEWDWHLDSDWSRFSTMIGAAAYWMQRRGKRTVLGGMCPADVNWLGLMCERGVIAHIDAVGVHAFPGTWQPHWKGWSAVLDRLRDVLAANGSSAELWITETGYSTWDHRQIGQVTNFIAALQSDARRVYWYSYQDMPADAEGQEGFHFDERHYHT